MMTLFQQWADAEPNRFNEKLTMRFVHAPESIAQHKALIASLVGKKDHHKYRDDSREHCVEMAIIHHDAAMRYAREAAAITARSVQS